MKFREERTLKIQDGGLSWAEYKWDPGSNLWRYHRCSEGFFRYYDFPTAFSEAERLLLTIQYSNQ